MHSVIRPDDKPPELEVLRQSGGEHFGSLDAPLDALFHGVCAYCERKPLWRSRQDGVGADDTDLPDREGLLFTCDHFKPRHLLCNSAPGLARCSVDPPPHACDCEIYNWHNLVYACQACNAVKGGQWPSAGDAADSYVNPCVAANSATTPASVFQYDLESGRLTVRAEVSGVARANATQTIRDLALNDPRERIETTNYSAAARRISLADLRQRWAADLKRTLDLLVEVAPAALVDVIRGFVAPESRFSSICRQLVEESPDYRRYLP